MAIRQARLGRDVRKRGEVRGAASQDNDSMLVRRHVFHNTLRQVFDFSPMALAEAGRACWDAQHLWQAP